MKKSSVKGVALMPYGWRFMTRIGGAKGPLVRKCVSDPTHLFDHVTLSNMFLDWKAEERKQRGRPVTTKGTFEADVHEKYLPDMDDRPDIQERKRIFGLWIKEFGTRSSQSIEAIEITRVGKRWMKVGPLMKCVKWDADHPKPKGCKTGRWIEVAEPVSIFQVANRISMLEAFFTHAYPGLVNPARQAAIRKGDKPSTPARDIDYATVEKVLAAMETHGRAEKDQKRPKLAKSQARARVMAYTGIPQAQLKLIEKHDLHLDSNPPWVFKRGRNKGHGTDDAAWPLSPQAVDAFRKFVEMDAFGEFSNSALNKSVKRACAKAGVKHEHIKGARQRLSPYDFRHSFATEILKRTANVEDVQQLCDHKERSTSEGYAKRAIVPARQDAMKRLIQAHAFEVEGDRANGK